MTQNEILMELVKASRDVLKYVKEGSMKSDQGWRKAMFLRAIADAERFMEAK